MTYEQYQIYYLHIIGKIINAFSGVEAAVDGCISIYFGKLDTMNDLTTFIHILPFDIKLQALRIIVENKCPDAIKNIELKYLIYENQKNDIFFKSLGNFKTLRNAVAHSLMKQLKDEELQSYVYGKTHPVLEFEIFERPDDYNESSYIKVRKKITYENNMDLTDDINKLNKILVIILNSITGQPPADKYVNI